MTYRLKCARFVTLGDELVALRQITLIAPAAAELEAHWVHPATIAKMRAEGRVIPTGQDNYKSTEIET